MPTTRSSRNRRWRIALGCLSAIGGMWDDTGALFAQQLATPPPAAFVEQPQVTRLPPIVLAPIMQPTRDVLPAIGLSGAARAHVQLTSAQEPQRPVVPEVVTPPPGQSTALPVFVSAQVIDLEAAWRLAGIANPTIAAAQESVRESVALQQQARVMLLPSLNAGGNYHLHNGTLQAPLGEIRTVHEQSLYYGGGARALAGQTVQIPAIRIFAHLGDAIYEPLAARQRVSARQSNATAVRNSTLLDVTAAYLDLMSEEARLEAIRLTESEAQQIVQLTAAYAKTGQGRMVDAKRAKSEWLLIHANVQRTEERLVVASNELARLLHLDPSTLLHAVGGAIQTVRLVNPDVNLESLIGVAFQRRPELAAASARIAEGQTRYRQERMRPLFPLVSVGVSGGGFGGGSNGFGSPTRGFVQGIPSGSEFGSFKGRSDADVFAVWSLQNLGAGNVATQRQRRAQVQLATEDRSRTANIVRREVAEAYTNSETKWLQVDMGMRQLSTSDEGFRQDLIRIRGGEGRPIEVLNSLRLLASARQDVILAIMGYNQAQFELFVALGQPPYIATLPTSPVLGQ